MHHDFRDFLRHGGSGAYIIHQRSGLTFGHRLSGKSQRPGDDRQRQAFRERLENVAAENARMIDPVGFVAAGYRAALFRIRSAVGLGSDREGIAGLG